MKQKLLLFLFALLPITNAGADVEINEQNFPNTIFRNWVLKQSYGEDGVLTDEEIADVREIWVDSKKIKSLKGIEYFKNLVELYCYDNTLSALDVSQNTELEILEAGENQLTVLDVSQNVALKRLTCNSNKIKTLDVSQNTLLTELYCWTNQLTSLDVSNNAALKVLNCNSNKIPSLDVSKNTELMVLECFNNQLTELDVSANTKLQTLVCGNNQLTTLDITNNPALELLWTYNCLLTELDVSKNPALQNVACDGNQITALDFQNNPNLIELCCYNNGIRGEAMDSLIASLPKVESGKFYVIITSIDDPNICSSSQIAAARAKGWIPYCEDKITHYWKEMEVYETSRQLLLAKTIGDVTYSLYGEVYDKYHIHTNPDAMYAYLSKLTLDVTTEEETKTYLLDDNIFLEEHIGDAGRPCMVFDMDNQQMAVFCISAEIYNDYGVEGCLYTSSLQEMNFTKEVLYTRTNQGQYCNFVEMPNGKLGLSFFRFAGYYAMMYVRSAQGVWSMGPNQSIQNPDDYYTTVYLRHDRALITGNDYSPTTEEQYQAALEALPNKSKFLIFTIFDSPTGPKKYYLTAAGAFTDSYEKSRQFIFTQMSDKSFFATPGWKLSSAFTNPKLTNGPVGEIIQGGKIERYTEMRNDWEGKVFYKKGDYYAVRSTNAPSVVWGADTYWTIIDANDDGVPEPGYATIPCFIWQVEVDDPDGISSPSNNPSNEGSEMYDLSGRRISSPRHKGIYINNGKKVVY